MYVKVAVLGQTNTGKTSIFNRFVTTTRTIVSCEEYTTTDNQYGCFTSNNKSYIVIDTPGFPQKLHKENIESLTIYSNILLAIRESDILFFVLTQDVVNNVLLFNWYRLWLKKIKKPVIFILNKIDEVHFDFFEKNTMFYGILFCAVSAKFGVGFTLLRKHLEKIDYLLYTSIAYKHVFEYSFFVPRVRIALLGKSNVGKSTLFNLLSNVKRSNVFCLAGTTKECVYSPVIFKCLRFLFTDTVGSKLTCNTLVRFYDILVFVFDCKDFLKFVDKSILKESLKRDKVCIVLFNKCDKLYSTVRNFTFMYKQRFLFLQNFMYIVCSAKYSFNTFFMYTVFNFLHNRSLFFYSSQTLTRLLKEITSSLYKVYYKKKNIVFSFAFSTKRGFSSIFIYGKNLFFLENKHKRYIETEMTKRLGNFLFITKYIFVQINKN